MRRFPPAATAAQLGAVPDLREAKSICHFRGPAGFGKRAAAAALSFRAGLRLLTVECETLAPLPLPELAGILDAIRREALLQPAAVYFDGIEQLAAGG